MSSASVVLFVSLFGCLAAAAITAAPEATTAMQPVYVPEAAASEYIPHATYAYADAYGPPPTSYISAISGYLGPSHISALMPSAGTAVQFAFRFFAKLGLLLMGSAALLIIGGLFTSVICSLTPICTINFAGFGNIDREAVRSMMTPEKIQTAAALVQDAIGKYQRMHRVVRN